jgi:hypothetical protein
MTSPQEETKIELVTEAIEALILATVVVTLPARNPEEHRANHRNVVDARVTVSNAFRALLQPTLRVVSDNPAPVKRPKFPGGIDDMNLA